MSNQLTVKSIHHSRFTLITHHHYSVLKLFTGLASAAFIAWKLTVINAINMAAVPAITNAVQPICILNAKSCNHLFTPQYANGAAIAIEMQTMIKKSFVSNDTILETE